MMLKYKDKSNREPLSWSGQRGFTLLEMVVSIGLFSVLVIVSIGITLGVSQAQVRAANVRSIQDNIRFGLELITREMRTGSSYALTVNCGRSFGGGAGSEITFITSAGEPRVYFWDESAKTILQAKQNITSADCTDPTKVSLLTSAEVLIEGLRFQLRGERPVSAGPPFDGQPLVTLALKVIPRDSRLSAGTSMNLQTTIVQRLRDL